MTVLLSGSILIAACGDDDASEQTAAGDTWADGESGHAPSDVASEDRPEVCDLLTEEEIDVAFSAAGFDLDVGPCGPDPNDTERGWWPAEDGLGMRIKVDAFASEAEAIADYESRDRFKGATSVDGTGFRHNQTGGLAVGGTHVVSYSASVFSDSVEEGRSAPEVNEVEIELLTLLFERLD